MNKEIKVKFDDDIDLIGVITITDSIREGLRNLMEIGDRYKIKEDYAINSSLLIFTKPRLILDEEVMGSEFLTRDRSEEIPDVLSCEFNLHRGEETGYFCFRLYGWVEVASDYEVIEVDSETVSVKDLLK